MTPKNLFNIILKIFGLFFLKDVVYFIPQWILSIPFETDNFGKGQYNKEEILSYVLTFIVAVFYGFVIYQLLFNTNKIIDTLKLDRGFDQQEFSFSISSSLILTISLIVIGGIILIDEIPNFFFNIFKYFQMKVTPGMIKLDSSYMIISGVKILIGILIIGERKRIVGFIEKPKVAKNRTDEFE